MTKKVLTIAKVIVVLIPIVLLGWVLNKQFSPLGKLVIKKNFNKESPFISDLYPRIRVSNIEKDGKEHYQTIKDDAVYFDLELPRWYSQATLDIKFQSYNPIFEIRGRKDKDQWTFVEKSLESTIINQAIKSKDWHETIDKKLLLLAKNTQYSNIQNFLDNPPDTDKVATYFYDDLSRNIKLADYQKSDKTLEIKQALRGSHTIYTYIKDEELDFNFSLQDINRGIGEDKVNINVYQQKTGEIIYASSTADDGTVEATGQTSKIQQTSINIPDLEEGIYKVEIIASNDLLIRDIKTKQNKLIFGQRIFIANSLEYIKGVGNQSSNTDFYSNGKKLVISTSHPNSFQTLSINNNPVIDINQTNDKYVLGKKELTFDDLSLINSPKSDLFIESDGYFSFSLDSFFFPVPTNINKLDSDTKLDDLDYIIADSYTLPTKNEDGWSTNTVEFDLSDLYINDDNKVQFMLSSPGLHDNEKEVRIAEIKVTLEKPPLTLDNFTTRLKNFVK